jgi:sRNA-binding carbon storage regulator CsrA
MGLVLTRRTGESVRLRLGDKEVSIRAVLQRGCVRLHFRGDPEVEILREELIGTSADKEGGK